jgi:hypothetical protein
VELYVYYRVPAARLPEATAAVHATQRALCERHPGLHAALLRRTDAAGDAGDVTLMETYASPGGLDDAFAAELDAAAAAWAAAVGAGARHVERFARLAA